LNLLFLVPNQVCSREHFTHVKFPGKDSNLDLAVQSRACCQLHHQGKSDPEGLRLCWWLRL
jgi:hypothetical protein